MLAIGDKVEIMGGLGDTNRGKYGKIVQIDARMGPDTRQVVTHLPKRETAPVYSVKLDSGRTLNHLREQQLRKI
jgi:hypothetical protein